jgi:predicted dehydrogenase
VSGFPESLPRARTPDPRSAPSLRWGVMGTERIAERFVAALLRFSDQQVSAVGSRSDNGAQAFAGRFGIGRAHGSYEALVADPEVDVVFVATPHNTHRSCALLALEADKHALIEKPIALNAAQAREIAELAQRRERFCMEAYWTAFLPKFDVLRQVLAAGALGEISAVVADFGEWFPAEHRIQRRDLAGGPMLDLGTYLISFVIDVLGAPDHVLARGVSAGTGVNGQTAMILTRGGQQAVLHTSILANTPTVATIAGSQATISIDQTFYQPGGFTMTASDGSSSLRWDEPRIGHDALHFQAAEVARRIHAGETGSPLRPLSVSIEVLHVMDEVRRQTGDLFPDE